jgi:hypothetical protein
MTRLRAEAPTRTISNKGLHTPVYTGLSTPIARTPESTGASSVKSSVFKRPAASFGATKFNATFSSNDAGFAADFSYSPDDVEKGTHIHSSAGTGDSPTSTVQVQPEELHLGVQLLRRFPTFRTYKSLLRALGPYNDLWLSPKMIGNCLLTFWSNYGSQMQGSRSMEDLKVVATDICINSSHELHVTDESQWLNWFGGSNLRWEMIGNLFAFFGIAFYSFSPQDRIFELPEQQGRDRHAAALYMRDCAKNCVEMCTEHTNDITVVMVKNLVRLDSVLLGDESRLNVPW